jgi:hypothetical protein
MKTKVKKKTQPNPTQPKYTGGLHINMFYLQDFESFDFILLP